MTHPTDSEMLRGVATDRSEAAFGLLVRRHLAVVYASALRQVRDPATAADVTQAAFVLLWQRAGRLRHGEALCGWLLTVVRLAARDANRRRATRQRHEHRAAQMKSDAPGPDWDHLRRVLDAGLADLSPADRTAVALRYLAGHTSDEVAARIGVTEASARKRTQRALVRLRAALARRGLSTPADVLAAGLSAVGVVTPPRLADDVRAAVSQPSPAVVRLTRSAGRPVRSALLRPLIAAAAVVAVVAVAGFGLLVWVVEPPAKPVAAAQPATRSTIVPTTLPAADQARELDRLEAGLAAQIQLLSNLRVEATARWERWDATAQTWSADGRSASTAWHINRPDGPARIDYAARVLPWTGGAGPFSWEVSDHAFDGQADRLLQIEVGTPDHRGRILQRVEVRHKRNTDYDGFDSGWSASTFGDGNGRTCLDIVRELRLGASTVRVARVPVAGDLCLAVTGLDANWDRTYYFDPGHGYAFRGDDWPRMFHEHVTVDRLAEPMAGLFYPAHATSELDEPGVGRLRATFTASSVVANDPRLDPAVFRLLPPGVPVFDMDAPGRPKRIAN